MSDGRKKKPSQVTCTNYNAVDRSRYTTDAIAALSDKEWLNLDLWAFVIANVGRYTAQAIAVHREVFPTYYDPEEILHELLASTVHQVRQRYLQNINVVGRERSKLLFSTMRANCTKFIPKIMAMKYNVRIERRVGEQDYSRIFSSPSEDDDGSAGGSVPIASTPSYAACEMDAHHDDSLDVLTQRAVSEREDDRRVGVQLTLIREHITGRDMEIMTQSILDASNNDKIAVLCKTQPEVIAITRHRLRRKLKKIAIEKGPALRRQFAKETSGTS